ncbi:CobW family GTP-binding protein [Youngiibacter fragilis]|uniref:Cobalamin biosynthesis protein CobW n=1 Tax=Youngiibacter fragilis 232.1 TaxID=994573 RepID=V7IB42_9CLOT|nr:GTP-binding protein [Youngiibacter fragilis]ETA82564.1 cobalamin biosynthesis protein CobW [Youngiibacter fragilis 232.1]
MGAVVHVVSGFLGSGKTTLIRHLMEGPFKDKSIAIIENEFGEIGIDGEILKRSGTRVREISSGCICCSLSGDFRIALREIADQYSPEVIIIEPSGVARASDIVDVCKTSGSGIIPGSVITVIDTRKYFSQLRNFRGFYRDQIASAGTVLLTRTGEAGEVRTRLVEVDISSITPGADIISDLEDNLLMKALDGEIVRVKGILLEKDCNSLKVDCIEDENMVEMIDSADTGEICFIGKYLKRDNILRFMEDGNS